MIKEKISQAMVTVNTHYDKMGYIDRGDFFRAYKFDRRKRYYVLKDKTVAERLSKKHLFIRGEK